METPTPTPTPTPPDADTDTDTQATVDLDAMAADLEAVDQALVRLDAGTYGTCEVCDEALPDELLGADPVARRCAHHAEP